MRFNYIVYPQARKKIDSSGLEKKIKKASSEGIFPYFGHTLNSDIISIVKEMVQEGYFKTLPKEEKKHFTENLNKAFTDRKNNKWKVHRNNQIIEESAEAEDFYLMIGWLASFILSKEEIWDYRKFGFSSINDFVGSIGASIWSSNNQDFRGGYEWITKTPNGRVIQSNISGDSNLDLRIYQTDLTPDKTIDPTGAEVSYRPELEKDRKCVAAYHSTEQNFLIGVLKWIHQQKISSEMLSDNGKPLINYAFSLGYKIGNATECFDVNISKKPIIELINFYDPIPILDENYSTDKPIFDFIMTITGDYFGMYIGSNKELMFSFERKKEIKPKKEIELSFQPEDADHLLKGIGYQAMKGLGRTAPQKLISLIDYRFSGEMDKDLEAFKQK
nr:hypothetical protein [Candidatus Woesearchaeota archaeon]